jgi:hypothetical protein
VIQVKEFNEILIKYNSFLEHSALYGFVGFESTADAEVLYIKLVLAYRSL